MDSSLPAKSLEKTKTSWWQGVTQLFTREEPAEEERAVGAPKVRKMPEVPTVALARQKRGKSWWRSMMRDTLHTHAVAWIWPGRLEGFFAAGVSNLVARTEMDAAGDIPNHAFFDPLFVSDQGLPEMAHLLLALGLNARDLDVRGAATEVLLEAIAEERLEPAALVQVLSRIGPWSKPNRCAECLGRVAAESALHECRVGEVLEGMVAGWRDMPHGAHHVLAVLRDVHIAQGRALGQEARAVLEQAQGRSKTAHLARELTGLQHSPDAARRDGALRQALAARLERAERWQRRMSSGGPTS